MQLGAATLSTPLSTSIAREALSVQSMPELARLLRQLRGRRADRQRDGAEWAYRELAATSGWSHAAIGAYFTGATLPPTDRFDQLVWFLGAGQAEHDLLVWATAAHAVTCSTPLTPRWWYAGGDDGLK